MFNGIGGVIAQESYRGEQLGDVVMTCRLAEPARTGCHGEDGSVLMPLHSRGLHSRGLHSRGLRCRGLQCRLLRLGRGTGDSRDCVSVTLHGQA